MPQALLVDNDPTHVERVLKRLEHQLHFRCVESIERAVGELRRAAAEYELVIVNVSDERQPWLANLEMLHQACANAYAAPSFLCMSNRERKPEFEVALERKGARYVFER